MERFHGQKKSFSESLLSTPTPARASGAAFSIASVLPSLLAVVFLIVLAIMGAENYQEKDWYIYVSYLLSPIAFSLVLFWYLNYTKTPFKIACQKQKCKAKYFAIAVLMQIGLFSLSELNAYFLQFLSKFGYQDSGILLPSMDGVGFLGVLFVVAVLPAVFEEIMFRGILLGGLKSFGKWGAVFICGALFSLYHQNPAQTLYQFCCGVAFALVAVKAGSILPTVLSHFLNNAFILTLTKYGISEFTAPAKWIIFSISAVCLVVSILLLIQDNQSEEVDKKEKKRFFTCVSVGIAVCAFSWLFTLISGF